MTKQKSKVAEVVKQHSDEWGGIMAHEPWVDFAREILEAAKDELSDDNRPLSEIVKLQSLIDGL